MALADYVKYDPDILRRKLAGEYQLANQQQALQNAQMNQALAQQLAPYQQQEQLLQVQKLQQALDPAFQAQQNALNLQNRLAEVTAVQEIQNRFNAQKPIEIGGRGWLPDPNDPTKYIEVIKKVEDPYAILQRQQAELNIEKAKRESEEAKRKQDPVFQESELQKELRKIEESARAKAKGEGPKADKAPTEGQAAYQVYGNRMNSSNKILEKLENIKFPPWGRVENFMKGLRPNELISNDVQSWDQAKIDFITAALRKESGATIQPSEFEVADKLYFPQPGESQKTVDQKRKTRQGVISDFNRLGQASGSGNADSTTSTSTQTGSLLDRLKSKYK